MPRCILLFPAVTTGMDTQLVVRPLLDKVEKNTQESALRKIVFPHVRRHSVDWPPPQAVTLMSESTIKLLACVCVPPQRSLACCAKKAGLLLFQFPGHLELWRVGESDGNGETDARTLNTGDAPKATSEVFFSWNAVVGVRNEPLSADSHREPWRPPSCEDASGETDSAQDKGVWVI